VVVVVAMYGTSDRLYEFNESCFTYTHNP